MQGRRDIPRILTHIARQLIHYRNVLFGKPLTYLSQTFEGKSTREFLPENSIRRRKRVARLLYNLLFALTLAIIISSPETLETRKLNIPLGEVPEFDLISPVSGNIESNESTRMRKEELARAVAPVYDYDENATEDWLQRWELCFITVRQEFYSGKPRALSPQLSQRVLELTHQTLTAKQLALFHGTQFGISIEKFFIELGEHLVGKLIASANLFPSYNLSGITIRSKSDPQQEALIRDVSRIWSLSQAREFFQSLPRTPKGMNAETARELRELVAELTIPNLSFNRDLTQKRIANAISTVKQTTLTIKKGQTLVRRGEKIRERELEILQAVRNMSSLGATLRNLALIFFILALYLSVVLRLNITRASFWYISLKDALFFLGMTAVSISTFKFLTPVIRQLLVSVQIHHGAEYLVPLSATGIIIHLMMGKEIGLTFSLITSCVCGYLLDQNYFFMVWSFTTTTTAIQSIRSCKQRTDLYKCGILGGLVGLGLILTFTLVQATGLNKVDWNALSLTASLGFISGILSAVLTSSLIPILEAAFGYTTSLKLLELSNFNHPILHNLMMKAPGTYHHSVIVGSLAEVAADKINANSLLARVAAYYHDIGKMNKPLYFIENQTPQANPHNQLQPSMSAKILFSHVKDGVRMGEEFSLGTKILGIIEQHHGTTLASYFFNKAKNLENRELSEVKESDFRYPGPRPQSREAAIVMLADACEAATRSISDPTAIKIQTMVRKIINNRFLEEQFSECDLTLNDLQVVEESFTRTLTSLYHHRIEYPGQRKTLEKAPNDSSIVKKTQST